LKTESEIGCEFVRVYEFYNSRSMLMFQVFARSSESMINYFNNFYSDNTTRIKLRQQPTPTLERGLDEAKLRPG
jgi:hypothetical protein